MEQAQINEREFARFAVRLRARFRVVENDEELETLSERLLETPSVWAPEGESELWKLADSPGSGPDGLLARAILDIARQVERLNGRLMDDAGPMSVGSVVQLSGGGIRFSTSTLLKAGDRVDLRLMDDESEAPPIRILGEVVHVEGTPPAHYGLAFKTIHPVDRERLMRYIYHVQRRELRRATRDREE